MSEESTSSNFNKAIAFSHFLSVTVCRCMLFSVMVQAKEKPTEDAMIDAGPGCLHPETAVLMKMGCVSW